MILLDGNSLTLEQVVQAARAGEKVELSSAGEAQILHSRAIVDRILEEERPVYGVSTGFGDSVRYSLKRKSGRSSSAISY